MFNEITGSLSILAKFSVKETKDSTIDEVLLSVRKSNVSNSINLYHKFNLLINLFNRNLLTKLI